MARFPRYRNFSGVAGSLFLAALLLTSQVLCADATDLARNKPASASSIENDEHAASAANDGDPKTCWRADDEPEGTPAWWQVDLEKSAGLSGCAIRWPFKGMHYRYKVEGSANGKDWSMLSDQSHSRSIKQVHRLSFDQAMGVRYVRITITGFDDGCWASLSEVKIFAK